MTPTPKKKVTVEKGPPGRPKHEVWTLGFRRVLKQCEKTHRTIHAAYCVICSKVLCNTASKRLSAHRRICSFDGNHDEVAESESEVGKITKIITPENSTTITFVDMDDTTEFVADQSSTASTAAKTEYTFVNTDVEFDDFKTNTATSTESKLDMVIAKFFIGCNIPFSIADSPYFKKFFTTLNPSAKLVTSQQLAGPLLDAVYSKIHVDTKVSPTSVLLVDGWRGDIGHSRTITVMLKTETNETIFMDNYELSSGSKDSMVELTDITKSCIMEAYDKFKTDVYAVILGNNYTLKLTKDDELWQFPCSLQLLESLIKDCITQDFLNIICKILKHCNMVFNEDDLEDKIASETRWTNVKFILEFCITNMDMIQTVLSDDSHEIKLTKDLKCNFFDEDFIHRIENCNSFLDSIQELSAVCHMPKSSIADVVEQWLSWQIPNDDSEILDKAMTWRSKALKIHGFVANYLHPGYKGQKLTAEQMNKVDEFLLNFLDAEGLDSLQAYANDEGIFKNLNQKENLTAKTYWGFTRRTHSNLSVLALKLLAIPAAITSNFSEYFNSIKNNTLKPNKMRKLFAVYYHLKEKEETLEME